jgi:hypothetical protein
VIESLRFFSRSGPVTAVWSFQATEDQRGRALATFEATALLQQLGHEEFRSTLVALAGLAGIQPRQRSVIQLLATIEAAVETGRLLLIEGWSLGQSAAAADERAPSRIGSSDAVVSALMAGRETLAFEGHLYRFSKAESAGGSPDTTQFQVVHREEARRLVSRMRAGLSVATSVQQALVAVAQLLVHHPTRGSSPGVLLLRRLPQEERRLAPTSIEPPLTPSRLRRLALERDIEVRFIEAGSGRPIADAAFLVQTPDGDESRMMTSSTGALKLTGLAPGLCTVTSLIEGATIATSYEVRGGATPPHANENENGPPVRPSCLVAAEAHHVKTGETPASIAEQAGIPWETITHFNWETSDPDQLQGMFRRRLGCTRRTPDAKTYVFDDKDDPGIILLPRPWQASFSVGEVHTVQVAPMRTVYITLENEVGLPIPGAAYELTFADGSQRRGRLGRSGIARLTGVPYAAFSITYPDQKELLARSLAASVRRAFDEQATGPLFYLLGQEQEVIDQAASVYAELYNDLTGNGLVADIDQVVTDPEARPPLTFLCKLAGLAIEGADTAIVQRSSPAAGLDDE